MWHFVQVPTRMVVRWSARRNSYFGTNDTDFEKRMQAIDCMMNKEMRIVGFDSHQSCIVTFMQQMIPHHANAVNMAKIVLKHAPAEVAGWRTWTTSCGA